MDKFVNLHVHSTYSFQDGFGMPEQYAKRAKELNQIGLGITDHGNTSGHYKLYKEAKKQGIKPILGCELYMAPDGVKDEKNYYHITAIAFNGEGYHNLLQLVTKSWQEGFRRKPLVKKEDLFEYQEGLVITSGCPSGKVCQDILNKRDARKELNELKKNIKHFYIEIQPWSFEMGKGLIVPLYNFSKELDIPMVATMDCHYVEKGQDKLQEILLCIQSGDDMYNPNRWKFDQNDFYMKTREEMKDSFQKVAPGLDFSEAMDNTVKIADMVDFEFPTSAKMKFPMKEEDKVDFLYKLCNEGMKSHGFDKLKNYKDRMEYEFDLIKKKDFVDYFLIMTDLVQWAKKNDILVGPGRGSSAGSLMCYLLRITEVDPIEHGLIFERFIDINREDLPDIDVDFEDERRVDIKRYLEEKYGKDKVAALATFTTFKGKIIIQDFGRIYKIPFDITSKLKSVVIERSGGDSRASFTLEDTFNQFGIAKNALKKYPMLNYAKDFEGQIRNLSSHASGIAISNEPLTNFCALYKHKEENTLSLDYKDSSDLGILKLDILGLNTLTSISKALKLIEKRTKKKIDIYNISLDDPKIFRGFRNYKKLFGIFQFDGQSTNQVCRQLKPENFEEIVAINALSRPGPMHGIDSELNEPITSIYIARKQKKLPWKTAHPLLENITKDTQGVVIYQEQVMRAMRDIGKMSWKDTAEIRKLMSRSQGVERFNDFKDKFALGARENGLEEKEIDNIWDALAQHGSWSFNKSHSVSYSVISYWTMWLKVYYPIEYYAAMASTMLHEDKKKRVIKEYLREGYKLLPFDINKSKESFIIEGKELRLGFEQIKGTGKVAAEKIVSNAPYSNIRDLKEKSGIGKKHINLLSKVGALESIGGANETLLTLFGPEKETTYEENMTFEEKLKIVPLSVDFNILENWNTFIKDNIKWPVSKIENISPEKNTETILGIVYDKNLKDKVEEALSRGKPSPFLKDGKSKYCNFILEDDTDFVTVRVSASNFEKFSKLIFEEISDSEVIMVKGRMGDGIRMFFANEIISLPKLKDKIEKKVDTPLNQSERILMGEEWVPGIMANGKSRYLST